LADRRPLRRARWVLAVVLALLIGVAVSWLRYLRMPGTSFSGSPGPLASPSLELRRELEREVRVLSQEIGERHLGRPEALRLAENEIERELDRSTRPVGRQTFEVGGHTCSNFEIEIAGGERRNEIVIVGAHYDTVPGTPGADDNATGVAALLALGRHFGPTSMARTLRFVAFTNEEPPYFQTADMGSARYAKRCRERGENVVAMLSLESIGYFSSTPDSQKYPPPLGLFYPSRGDFVGFVGNPASRDLVHRTISAFRERARVPSEGAAVPAILPGVGWSDHWAFWQQGYPAAMVTDTAPFRNPGYHEPSDTAEKLDYDVLTRAVEGLEHVIAELCR
jgi:hypothetical protein